MAENKRKLSSIEFTDIVGFPNITAYFYVIQSKSFASTYKMIFKIKYNR